MLQLTQRFRNIFYPQCFIKEKQYKVSFQIRDVLEDIGTNWKVEEMIKKWKQTGKWEFRMFATLAFNELRLNIQIHF